MKQVYCKSCNWVYKDPNPTGMGIHRAPMDCIKCGGHMIVGEKDEKS